MAAAHQNWSSRAAFIFAAVGSAVGLGNIWKFPYEAGAGGGGAFVLIYLLFVFGIGVPVMIAELSLGRRGHLSPPNAMKKVAQEEGRSTNWQLVGWLGIFGAFIVLSFYSVIAGWVLEYFTTTVIEGAQLSNADTSGAAFGGLLGNVTKLTFWHAAFMALTGFVVARGIQGGLEKAVTWLMPALFILLLGLAGFSLITGDATGALTFLFSPDFSKLTPDIIVQALGQAFFSLSLGLGTIMTYGAYLPRDISIPRSALIIAAADTGVALLAGLAIFPIVFAYGLEPGSGPGLIFVTLPIAFGQMTGGTIVGAAFFLLLAIAALTSSISLLEPMVSRLEEREGWTRTGVAIGAGVVTFLLGMLSLLSLNVLADMKFGFPASDGNPGTIFDNLDFLTNNIVMPLGGLLVAVFVGWRMSRASARDELHTIGDGTFGIWYAMVRFVCPIALVLIFLSATGLLF